MLGSRRPTDLELLAMHADGVGDGPAWLRGVTLIRSGTEEVFAIGSGISFDLAKALEAVHERAPVASDPMALPPTLAACERLLVERGWKLRRYGILVHAIESPLVRISSPAILRSDGATPSWMDGANPGNWHPVEWDELLDGCLGPWTMVADGHRIVSICHTPLAMTDRTAVCGTWTDPDSRGRGYAAAATAEWATLLRASGRHLFYSHDLENVSSRRVTERLGLRLLGTQWGLRGIDGVAISNVHPLSRVARGR